MKPMRMLSHSEIQYGLEKGNQFVKRVLESFSLNNSYTPEEL